ncbi:MAG: hypothetical protein ACLS63_09445 [Flavonifractor plautii]
MKVNHPGSVNPGPPGDADALAISATTNPAGGGAGSLSAWGVRGPPTVILPVVSSTSRRACASPASPRLRPTSYHK